MNVIEIMRRWPDQETAVAHLEQVRWRGVIACPYCHSEKVSAHSEKGRNMPRHQCQSCRKSFSVTVGTIFHHTHLPLQTWFLAIALMLNAKKNLSNRQLARDLGLPVNTAWRLAGRIRGAMEHDPEQRRMFHGIVEMDETYVGGKPRKANRAADRKPAKRGRGSNKMPVVGIVERNGNVVAKRFDKGHLTARALSRFYVEQVDHPAAVAITDEYPAYRALGRLSPHFAVNHQRAYAVGDTHTNTIEGFWAHLKRAWYGQHHHFSRKHADGYIAELAWKYNRRKRHGRAVFSEMLGFMVGATA